MEGAAWADSGCAACWGWYIIIPAGYWGYEAYGWCPYGGGGWGTAYWYWGACAGMLVFGLALWPFAGEPVEDCWWNGDGEEGYGLPLMEYGGFMAAGE